MTAVVIALGAMVVALAFVSIFQAREIDRLSTAVREDLALFIHYIYGVEVGQAFAADRAKAADRE